MAAAMIVSFEGFPRTLERSALRPGRWFVAVGNAGDETDDWPQPIGGDEPATRPQG